MRMSLCLWVALLLLSPVSFAAGERPPPKGHAEWAQPIDQAQRSDGVYPGKLYYDSLSPDLRAKLDEKGQVLMGNQTQSGSYGGFIKAIVIFKQPKARVYQLMRDTTKQVLYLPRLKTAEAVWRPTNGELTEFSLKVLFSTYRFRVQHWFYPEYSRVEWHLDKSFKNDIKAQEGYWQLYALSATTTIGEYGTKVDTGLHVPDFVQKMFARSDIPKCMTAMRKYINSDGTWRRDD